jgi:hypothetical protein
VTAGLYTSRAMARIDRYRWLALLLLVVGGVLAANVADGQDDRRRVDALIRDLKNRDYETARGSDDRLLKYPQYRTQVVAALIDALKTGEWDRCSGDMRDSIAHTLIDLKAKDAVVPLLALVKSGKSIEHECAE